MDYRYVEHAHATLAYLDVGRGRPVVLIHGGLFESMDTERFWIAPGIHETLRASGRRVIAMDRRYAGGRTKTAYVGHNWPADAADLAALVDALSLPAVALIAGSNGCSSAVRLAIDRPDLVSSLILCWPATAGEPSIDQSLAEGFERAAARLEQIGPQAWIDQLGQNAETPVERQIEAVLGADERVRVSIVTRSAVDAARVVRSTAAALLQPGPLRGIDLTELGQLRMPVTLVPAPKGSPFHRMATVELLHESLPGSRVTDPFPETPHPAFAGHEVAFGGLIISALDRAGTQPA